MRKLTRFVLYGTSLPLLTVAGVALGRWVTHEPAPHPVDFTETDLIVGKDFPDTPLVEASGDTIASGALFSGGGRVILLIDPSCPACTEATKRWQRLIDAGTLGADVVIGISDEEPEAIQAYRSKAGLSFAIHRDVANRFRNTFRPYEVVVGSSGVIRSAGGDAKARIDSKRVHRALEQ